MPIDKRIAALKEDGNNINLEGLVSQFGRYVLVSSSCTGKMILLPALSVNWPTESVKGLRARGGYEVGIKWNDGKLISAEIRNINGKISIPIRYGKKVRIIQCRHGKSVNLLASHF